MLSQISLSRVPSELWAVLAAIIAFLSWLAKKLWSRGAKSKPDHITRAEFHQAIDATRDRIGASYLALADKIELQHSQVLTVLERQGANFERRLDTLDSAVARLDERTREASPHHSITPALRQSITPPLHQSTNPPIH